MLHTDYRGHASSDNDPNADYELRLPYAVDTINAVKAVKSSKLRFLDKEQGRLAGTQHGWRRHVDSTGGPARSRRCSRHLLRRSARSPPTTGSSSIDHRKTGRGTNRRIARTYGLPDESPEFWRAASPRPYFDRVTEPLLVHHGTQR